MSLEEDNVRVVKDFFAAIGRFDRQAALAFCDEDIEWIMPGDNWPLAGTRRGHAGVEAHFQTHSETMETFFIEAREFIAQGDWVMVVGYAEGKIKATDKTWKDDWIFAITVRNGKMKYIREYVDTQALAVASQMT